MLTQTFIIEILVLGVAIYLLRHCESVLPGFILAICVLVAQTHGCS